MIELNQVSRVYQCNKVSVTALKNISFKIEQRDMIAISGESGSGKTTLLSILGGLLPCFGGEYFYQGAPVHKMNQKQLADFRRENIGFIVQDLALIQGKTICENLELPLKGRYSKAIRVEMISEILQKLSMSDKIQCYPNELSGGEQQRIAIARAIIHKPKVVLADEPTGALDNETTKRVLALLHQINESGITIVLATHNEIVMRDCTKRYQLADGEIHKL